jgi:hypothetical protein
MGCAPGAKPPSAKSVAFMQSNKVVRWKNVRIGSVTLVQVVLYGNGNTSAVIDYFESGDFLGSRYTMRGVTAEGARLHFDEVYTPARDLGHIRRLYDDVTIPRPVLDGLTIGELAEIKAVLDGRAHLSAIDQFMGARGGQSAWNDFVASLRPRRPSRPEPGANPWSVVHRDGRASDDGSFRIETDRDGMTMVSTSRDGDVWRIEFGTVRWDGSGSTTVFSVDSPSDSEYGRFTTYESETDAQGRETSRQGSVSDAESGWTITADSDSNEAGEWKTTYTVRDEKGNIVSQETTNEKLIPRYAEGPSGTPSESGARPPTIEEEEAFWRSLPFMFDRQFDNWWRGMEMMRKKQRIVQPPEGDETRPQDENGRPISREVVINCGDATNNACGPTGISGGGGPGVRERMWNSISQPPRPFP